MNFQIAFLLFRMDVNRFSPLQTRLCYKLRALPLIQLNAFKRIGINSTNGRGSKCSRNRVSDGARKWILLTKVHLVELLVWNNKLLSIGWLRVERWIRVVSLNTFSATLGSYPWFPYRDGIFSEFLPTNANTVKLSSVQLEANGHLFDSCWRYLRALIARTILL